MERKFHGSESSLCVLFAPWNESAEERKGLESFFGTQRSLSSKFSHPLNYFVLHSFWCTSGRYV